MKTYAGIGSRETPMSVQPLIARIVAMLALDFVMRSGGSRIRSDETPGADAFFEDACKAIGAPHEVYLPRPLHDGHPSPLCRPTPLAFEIAKEHHQGWGNLSFLGQQLHARNVHIVLGPDCDDPVRFIVCWTPGGRVQGGTGQALRIAKSHAIPVVNLFNPMPLFGDGDVLERIMALAA